MGAKPGLPRRLVLAELQHHARNLRFTPHTTPVGLSPVQLANATGADIKKVRAALDAMKGVGQAENAGTLSKPLWRLRTRADAPALITHDRHQGTGTYTAVELQAFSDRPGAMDAFTLPSLVNGEPMPARRPSAQLVGALVDRSNNARG